VPLLVFGVNVAEPEIALNTMDGSREVAGGIIRGDTLTRAVGAFFVVGRTKHRCTPLQMDSTPNTGGLGKGAGQRASNG